MLSTLAKALLPCAAIAVMFLVARRRKISFVDEIGLRPPAIAAAALWLLIWIALISIEEHFSGFIEGSQAKHWPAYPAAIIALRILAIGLLGPMAEELAFRGLIMAALHKMRVALPLVILLPAAFWSIIHLQSSPSLLVLIFVDGIALGLARHFSGSLYVPIVMHMIGNLFSIYQSLAS